MSEDAANDLTRFYVFQPNETMMVWTYVGYQTVRDRDAALRAQFGKAVPVGAVAVSEHAWKPRKPKIEPVIRGLTDVAMPGTSGVDDPTLPIDEAGFDADLDESGVPVVAEGLEEVPEAEEDPEAA